MSPLFRQRRWQMLLVGLFIGLVLGVLCGLSPQGLFPTHAASCIGHRSQRYLRHRHRGGR